MRKNRLRKIITWSIAGILSVLLIYFMFIKQPPVIIEFQQEPLVEEKLYMEVSATGTINPIELVDVGTQVSGIISEVLVDYNEQVLEGQILARMDMRNLKSSLLESKANLEKAKVSMRQAERALKRAEELFKDGLIPKKEFEEAEDNFDNAKATYNIAKLQLEKNAVNLGYADIVSPITGVVISKNVEVGQTIAAAFATPTLFSIARDLSEMKIEASVDEADIGQVKPGQKVIFTVDAFPENEFHGVVTQVQLKASVVQNVVTYNVIINIPNPDLKLMPGMTATLIIRTEEKPLAITVPNSALTFDISETQKEKLKKEKYTIEICDAATSVWTLNGKTLKQVPAEILFTNGIRTAVKTDLSAGDSVITYLKIKVDGEEDGNLFMSGSEDE